MSYSIKTQLQMWFINCAPTKDAMMSVWTLKITWIYIVSCPYIDHAEVSIDSDWGWEYIDFPSTNL